MPQNTPKTSRSSSDVAPDGAARIALLQQAAQASALLYHPGDLDSGKVAAAGFGDRIVAKDEYSAADAELSPAGIAAQGPVGDFEGLLIMTWDPKEKAYKSYVFGNEFPGAVISTGSFEGDSLVFRGEVGAEGAKIAMRSTARLDETGIMKSEAFVTMPGKPEALMVTEEAKRKP